MNEQLHRHRDTKEHGVFKQEMGADGAANKGTGRTPGWSGGDQTGKV